MSVPENFPFYFFATLCLPVTLETRSKSQKSNQLLSLSQLYFHASLVKFCTLIQEISCVQEV